MAKNMRLNSFLVNLGSSMLPRNTTEGSIVDMIQRVRDEHLTFTKIILRITGNEGICADCGFQFEVNGKRRFYPMHVSSENRIGHYSNIAIGAKVYGLHIDPVQLSNLGVGQFHITKDGIKRTK